MNPFFSVFSTRHNYLTILYNKKFQKKRGFSKKVWNFFIFLTFFRFWHQKWSKYLQKWGKCATMESFKRNEKREKIYGTQGLYRYQNWGRIRLFARRCNPHSRTAFYCFGTASHGNRRGHETSLWAVSVWNYRIRIILIVKKCVFGAFRGFFEQISSIFEDIFNLMQKAWSASRRRTNVRQRGRARLNSHIIMKKPTKFLWWVSTLYNVVSSLNG